MIAAIVVGAFGFVIVVTGLSRFGSRRSQRRSVEEHQRALDVLGEVAKRRDGIAPVHAPSPQEIGRAHVHPTENAIPRFRRADQDVGGQQPAARLVLRSGPTPLKLPIFEGPTKRVQGESLQGDEVHVRSANLPAETVGLDHVVRFEAVEDVESPADSTVAGSSHDEGPPAFSGPPEENEFGEGRQENVSSHPPRLAAFRGIPRSATGRNPFILRRVASVAAIAIVLAAVGVGSWQLASSKPSTPRVTAQPPAKSHRAHHATNSTSKSSSGSSSLVHDEIAPTSTSPTIVTFPLSESTFTITFSASEPCWIGILPSQHGAYLWMTTVGAGTTTTYHASAPVYVRIGAPQYLVLKVDGVRLALPPKMIQPYDVTFTIGSAVSA